MKRKTWLIPFLCLLLCICGQACADDVTIDEALFPDPVFRAYVAESFDTDPQDGVLSEEELNAVAWITVPEGVLSIEGAEQFKSLNMITWNYCPLNKLDLSAFPNLASMDVKYASLTFIDISRNPKLENLTIDYAKITSVDLSNNPELTGFSAFRSALQSLDVSHNPKLQSIDADDCGIAELDVTNNPLLEYLRINNNELTEIDVSNNPRLIDLQVGGNHLSTIDLSGNPELITLDVQSNAMTSLDVRNNTKLTFLQCGGQPLESIDLSCNPELETLSIGLSSIRSLDLSHQAKLINLLCYDTLITELDLSHNPQLNTVWVYRSKLSHLDLSACKKAPEYCELYGTCYPAPLSGGRLALSSIPGLDISRISDLEGGYIRSGYLVFESNVVRYRYDCGYGISEFFSMRPGGVTGDGILYNIREDGTASIVSMPAKGDVVIPYSVGGHTVTDLGACLFRYKSGVTSVTIPATVTDFGEQTGGLLAYVFTDCPDLKAVHVDKGNPTFMDIDGVLYSKDGSFLYCYPMARAETEYHVPEACTWIDCSVFAGIKAKKHIYLENEDISWAQFTFANLRDMTVYYRTGGRAEERVLRDLHTEGFEQGGYFPTYVAFGKSEKRKALEEKIQAVVDGLISDSMSDRQKALALHDWIILNASYSLKYNDATGILVYGEALCEGYAKAYQMLLDKVGIPNRLVSGSAGDTEASAENHMWNQVKIDNVWFHVDCTWDDPLDIGRSGDQLKVSGLESHKYFMVSDRYIHKDHYWENSQDGNSGWQQAGNSVVFLDANGNRVTGWLQVDGGTFYFDADGASVIGPFTVDGYEQVFEKYCVFTDADGKHYAGRLKKDLPDEKATRIILPAMLTSVGEEAFAGTAAEVYELPEGIQEIRSLAFSGLLNKAYIIIPDSVGTIAEDAFEGSTVVFVVTENVSGSVRDYAERHGCMVVTKDAD